MAKPDAGGIGTGSGLVSVSCADFISFLPNGRSKFDIMPVTTATIAQPPFYQLRAPPRPVKGVR